MPSSILTDHHHISYDAPRAPVHQFSSPPVLINFLLACSSMIDRQAITTAPAIQRITLIFSSATHPPTKQTISRCPQSLFCASTAAPSVPTHLILPSRQLSRSTPSPVYATQYHKVPKGITPGMKLQGAAVYITSRVMFSVTLLVSISLRSQLVSA